MEFSDEDDFVLSQNSTSDYSQTQSSGYGGDILCSDSEEDNFVSIENENYGGVTVYDTNGSGMSSQSVGGGEVNV